MKCLEVSMIDMNGLDRCAQSILEFCEGHQIYAVEGEMGAGKTTLIAAICRKLGTQDALSSPTYSIINEYHIAGTANKIFHLDLYRLRNIEEAIEAGVEDCLLSGSYCFIEWPQLIERLLPKETVRITVKADGDVRNVSIFIR